MAMIHMLDLLELNCALLINTPNALAIAILPHGIVYEYSHKGGLI